MLDIIFAQLLHVDSRLLEADERGSDSGMYLFAFVCPEADDSSRMVGCLFGNVFLQIAVGYRSFVSERLVEFNDEVILEVFGNSAAVACSVADNLVFFRNHFDI